MTKTTVARRSTVIAIIADSREYDATTVRIGRDGSISALKDADKTFAGHDARRYSVGHIDDMVTADGARREGY